MVKEVGRAVSVAASPKQEAILEKYGEFVKITLRTHYRSGPDELAWVVPVPSKPLSVAKADDEAFRYLEGWTAPRFTTLQRTSGCGIGCSGGDSTPVVGRVVVAETGRAGIFDYTVLTASGVETLVAWLRDRQFAVPDGAESVLRRYVEKGWYWLAIRVRSEESDKPTLAMHPIKYTYHDTDFVYPLVISSVSADEENEIVLYVLADCRHRPQNWTNVTIPSDDLQLDDKTPSGTNYEKLVRQMTHRDGGHVFVTEFADDIDAVAFRPLLKAITAKDPDVERFSPQPLALHLTRLRAIVGPEAMDRDVTLVQDHGGAVRNDYYLDVHAASTHASGMALTALIFAGPWLGLWLLSRSHRLARGHRS
ncbi:MAG TPA: DUF2330 domain-containing protein [Thermoguttaceae bacterium]|nr:DUF2330 domain-containing protein [Thermoguttaceae bacterium]